MRNLFLRDSLAGIDVGIGVKEGVTAARATNKVLSNGGADVIAKLTPEQTKQFKTLASSTDKAQKQQLRQSLRQELGDANFDAANKVFNSSEFRELTDAEARLITGGGQVADSPFAGMDFNNLTSEEKAVLKQSYKITNRDGKPPILSRKNRKHGDPPIHIEERDGKYVIKNGHASSSNRLSNSHTMNKNYEAVYGKKPDGYQIHHVIPDNKTRDNPLAREAYNRGIFDLDRASNFKGLPEHGKSGEIVHRGSHGQWDRHVDQVLNDKKKELLKNPRYSTVEDIPDGVLEQALTEAELELQDDLVDVDLGLQEGWLKREPTGLKLSENEDSKNTETA